MEDKRKQDKIFSQFPVDLLVSGKCNVFPENVGMSLKIQSTISL
jgi:hypothetical protein